MVYNAGNRQHENQHSKPGEKIKSSYSQPRILQCSSSKELSVAMEAVKSLKLP